MNLRFQTVRQMIGDIFHLTVEALDSDAAVQEFSLLNTLHSSQTFLRADLMNEFLKGMESERIYFVTDNFQVQYVLAQIENIPVIFGPFCSLIWTRQDCITYLKRMGICDIKPMELLAYRSRFSVLSEREALHIVQSCVRIFHPAAEKWNVVEIDQSSRMASATQQMEGSPLRMNYSELIQERYHVEQRLISEIESGNAHAAIMDLRKLQQDVDFLKKMGTTLENERVGAAIVRTILRMSALRAGLPAPTIDLLSRKNTVAIINATSVEDIYKEKENMIRAFCQEIQSHKQQRYSNLVLSVIHYIEHQYAEEISIQQIADELNVSINHLTVAFRKETSVTPGTYIRQIRMKQAARLLVSTDLSIQDISNAVGVPDANYFIKLFKKEYSLTPTQYRKFHRL